MMLALARMAWSPPGSPAVTAALLRWRLLSSANVTHIQACLAALSPPHFSFRLPPLLSPIPQRSQAPWRGEQGCVYGWLCSWPGVAASTRRKAGDSGAMASNMVLSSCGQGQKGEWQEQLPVGSPCSPEPSWRSSGCLPGSCRVLAPLTSLIPLPCWCEEGLLLPGQDSAPAWDAPLSQL